MKKIFILFMAFLVLLSVTSFAKENVFEVVYDLGDYKIVAEKYQVTVPHKYDGPVYSYRNYGVTDKEGNLIVENIYETILPPSDGRSTFMSEGKIGFFDENWDICIEAKYESNYYPIDIRVVFSEGLCAVGKRAKGESYGISWGYIDRDGNEVIDFVYDYVEPFNGGTAVVGIEVVGYNYNLRCKYGKIDKNGNVTEPFKFGYVQGRDYEYFSKDSIDVLLSENLVEINGRRYENYELLYPFINYLGFSYIPLTYYGCRMMGINCDWTKEGGVFLSSGGKESEDITGENDMESGVYDKAEFYKGKLTINGKLYEYGDTEYPLIHYKNVVYMPVLWKEGMDALSIDYRYERDDSKGEIVKGCMVFNIK